MTVGNHNHACEQEDHDKHIFVRHLPKIITVKLVRDPISVGIDPVRELVPVVFCDVGNTIEVAI
jgi:hypothetical protein